MNFKDIFPFVTFFLGVLLTPYIERRKEKGKIQSLKRNILVELEDELLTLERSIKIASRSIQKREHQSVDYQYISLGKRFNPILLEQHLKEVYSHFNQDTRTVLKNLLLLSEQIKENYVFVCENWKTDNLQCCTKEESMLFSMLSVYFVLNKLKNEADRFRLPDLSNQEIVEMAAAALQIPTPCKAS
ncbi:hypothetical protein [Yokenella regensburgei]|uniref:hypothetical protein n=1 Tax=Yokenella regensburgei TaxID=158877 RepID=UPI0031DB4AD7